MKTSWKSRDVSSKFDKYNDMLENILGFNFLFDIIKIDKSINTILDYGCGPGKVSARLTALNPEYNIIAVDESEKMLSIAKSKRNHPGISYQLISNDSLLFLNDNYIDCAIICFVIINNSDKNRIQKIINEIHRVLKPNGKLLILDSNPNAIGIDFTTFRNGDLGVCYENGSCKKQYLKINGEQNLILNDYYWTRELYEDILCNAGFELQKIIEPKISDIPIDELRSFESKYNFSQWCNEDAQAPFIIFQSTKRKEQEK
ncbi:methyltransferase UbiE [Vallitalea longa]|uniref:Methyltransferase UbiE n=1 Tax=Vallitalea longa TaxID=2936439 RepID=A0A9W5Y9Q5_9FIRM|nr:methyltransferase domain-containing protein [Vallitalea longa]GKX29159.1 methyltransferase UbiE [Vallitalea longa]